jgi:hypothetical protein
MASMKTLLIYKILSGILFKELIATFKNRLGHVLCTTTVLADFSCIYLEVATARN